MTQLPHRRKVPYRAPQLN